ncbi:hypothetical protein ACFVMC_02675 [Nocardia sp. NPDC127579]|uniref:hypothetical protein n=1 Tax=Nocardia sp. NPDC127579 TaxID=3345402 RepID=UPI003643D1D6
MTGHYAQIAFTDSVRVHQTAHGSARSYERMAEVPAVPDRLGENESWFIGERGSFYLSTVSETGWPYKARTACWTSRDETRLGRSR